MRVQLDMASGIANIRAGLKSVDVAVGFAVGPQAKVLATLNSSAGGKTSVTLAEVKPGNVITIPLTEKATVDCRVAWLVLL